MSGGQCVGKQVLRCEKGGVDISLRIQPCRVPAYRQMLKKNPTTMLAAEMKKRKPRNAPLCLARIRGPRLRYWLPIQPTSTTRSTIHTPTISTVAGRGKTRVSLCYMTNTIHVCQARQKLFDKKDAYPASLRTVLNTPKTSILTDIGPTLGQEPLVEPRQAQQPQKKGEKQARDV